MLSSRSNQAVGDLVASALIAYVHQVTTACNVSIDNDQSDDSRRGSCERTMAGVDVLERPANV
jgi:hypothetical protein